MREVTSDLGNSALSRLQFRECELILPSFHLTVKFCHKILKFIGILQISTLKCFITSSSRQHAGYGGLQCWCLFIAHTWVQRALVLVSICNTDVGTACLALVSICNTDVGTACFSASVYL